MSKDWSSASIWKTRGRKSPRNMSLIQVELQGGPRIHLYMGFVINSCISSPRVSPTIMEVYSHVGFFRAWSSHYYFCFGCVWNILIRNLIKTQVLEASKSLSLQLLPTNTYVFLVDWNFDEYMDIQHNHIWRETCFISITLGIRGVRFQGLQPFFLRNMKIQTLT